MAQAQAPANPSPHHISQIAVSPGVRLEVLDWGGTGEPMVFLPGLGYTAHVYDDFALRFRDRYHVYGITPRGFGASSRPDSGYDSASRARCGARSAIDLPAVLARDDVVFTRPSSPEFHQPLALFTAAGLRAALECAGLVVEVIASANPLLPYFQNVPPIVEQPEAESALRQLELAACECPGLQDAGGHIIAAARCPSPPSSAPPSSPAPPAAG